jgi:Flp pilus assembly pilin Flp
MLRNFLKNKKAQNTAEYALLIALVVAGVIAMQTYAQRALQARIHDASIYMATTAGANTTLGNSVQYEPYYLHSDFNSTRNDTDTSVLANGVAGYNSADNSTRTGSQVANYSTTDINDAQ